MTSKRQLEVGDSIKQAFASEEPKIFKMTIDEHLKNLVPAKPTTRRDGLRRIWWGLRAIGRGILILIRGWERPEQVRVRMNGNYIVDKPASSATVELPEEAKG